MFAFYKLKNYDKQQNLFSEQLLQMSVMEYGNRPISCGTCLVFYSQPKLDIDWNLSLFLWIPCVMKELHCTSEFFYKFILLLYFN